MEARAPQLVVHGAIGGVLAGAVVAAWFLIVDLLAGQPLATPLTLAAAALSRVSVSATVRLVAGYTALHFGVFALLGMAAAYGMGRLGIAPGLRHGVVFGLGVLTAVHYGGLALVQAGVLMELPVLHVLAANLLGGVAIMAYLHHAERSVAPLGWDLKRHRLIVQGVLTGLFGAVAVAVWFLFLDAVEGRPFFTPAALGSVVFFGASTPSQVTVSLGVIAAYTVLHVVAFCIAGVAFVWVANRIERTPALWLLALMAFIVIEGGFVATAGTLAGWVIAFGWWSVALANFLAVGVMAAWVWRTRPKLRASLTEEAMATMV